MYLLAFYVTDNYLQRVKDAVFAAGGGKIGRYDCCAWETAGTGQFRPGEGSRPFLGARHELESISELKVELVVADDCIQACVAALKTAHPYETPAYHVVKLEPF